MSSENEPRAGGSEPGASGEERSVPHRVIGTPPPAPAAVDARPAEPPAKVVPTAPEDTAHAKRMERVVAVLFVLAFFAGCGFIAAYIGLEVGSSNLPAGANAIDAAFRSNLALGLSLAVVLLALGAGSLIWVRHLTPNVETVDHRHPMRSTPDERETFSKEFMQGAGYSQVTKRPLIRRTLLLATAPLMLIPIVLLRDLGPLPGTSLRYTVWKRGTRVVVFGTNRPLRPSDITAPGSLITVIPEGYQDDPDALAKAGTILIRFEPGQLNIPTRYNGDTLISSQNWAIEDTIVAYSKICTHVGCPVALYEQTTHHILCPCHQSTFDAATGATVIFGPAPRPLPQLPLMLDSDGYLAAASDFTQPVGPSFWERG
jgi:ubiquinol-cytochrome c reductase iron-sulfur subunit